MKNNKKRNVGFLYEALVRELTKSIIAKDLQRQNITKACLLEFFNKKTSIGKQKDLFKSLINTKLENEYDTQRLIHLCIEENTHINQQSLFIEQNKLISFINKEIGHSLYENFVPNYKILSTINAIFNKNYKPEEKILFERVLRNDLLNLRNEETK